MAMSNYRGCILITYFYFHHSSYRRVTIQGPDVFETTAAMQPGMLLVNDDGDE